MYTLLYFQGSIPPATVTYEHWIQSWSCRVYFISHWRHTLLFVSYRSEAYDIDGIGDSYKVVAKRVMCYAVQEWNCSSSLQKQRRRWESFSKSWKRWRQHRTVCFCPLCTLWLWLFWNAPKSNLNHAIWYAAPQLSNKLLHSPCASYASPYHMFPLSSCYDHSSTDVNLFRGVFHSRLKTHLYPNSFPP